MKLEVGKVYLTREPEGEEEKFGKVVTVEEFRKIFGYEPTEDYKRVKRPFLAVYGFKPGQTPTFARLYEDGRSDLEEENWYDLVRPFGNILNK